MRLAIALLLAATTTSCIGDDDGDGTNYVAVTEIAAAFKDASCTYLTSCGLFPDKATCLAAELGSSGFSVDVNVAAAVGAGRVIYNGSNVKACFDALAARACDETSESARVTPAACRNVIAGTVIGGESCTIDEECISQSCSSGGSSTTCSIGLCIGDTPPTFEPAQVDSPCSSASGCVPGAYCDQSTGVCTLLKAQGTSCTLANECEYGLGCIGTTGSRTCGPLPAVGESCATDGVCRDEGTFCNFTTGLCEQVGLPTQMCTSSSQCSQYYPCNFSTSQCTKGPGLGEACSLSMRCFDDGTYCDSSTSICTALKSNGLSCQSDDECSSDYCNLDRAAPICEAPLVCF